MKFEWQKPDRTKVWIENPNEIAAVLNDLKERHDAARTSGSRTEVAALEVLYDDQYKQWLWLMAFRYQDDRKKLAPLIKQTGQALAWWDEWAAQETSKSEVSKLQRSLLMDLPKELWPCSWAEAAAIINRMPGRRVPSTDFGSAMQRLAEVNSMASSCDEMAADLANKFSKGMPPVKVDLDAYHAKASQLQDLIDAGGL